MIRTIIDLPFWLGCVWLFSLWWSLKRKKISNYIFGFLLIASIILSTKWLPSIIIRHFERRYPIPSIQTLQQKLLGKHYNIMVLGCGSIQNSSLPYIDMLSDCSLFRLCAGVRWYNLIPNGKLIGSGISFRNLISQGEIVAKAALELGVDKADTAYLSNPKSTFEEAKSYIQHFDKETPVLLVTDAIHLPRAVAYFKMVGVQNIIPIPSHFLIKSDNSEGIKDFIPNPTFLKWVEYGFEEWLGMLQLRYFN